MSAILIDPPRTNLARYHPNHIIVKLTDDLAYTRHQQITTFRTHGSCISLLPWHPLHIKRLELCGKTVQKDRGADNVRHLSLGCFRDIVADRVGDHHGFAFGILDDVAVHVLGFMLDTVVVEPLDRVRIGHAFERTGRRRELGVKGLDQRGRSWVSEKLVDTLTDLRENK